MPEMTREERNKIQPINYITDTSQILELRNLYNAIVKFTDQERRANDKLSKIENTTRAELKGYISVLNDAMKDLSDGKKITSNMADDIKGPLYRITDQLKQMEKEANTRHKKEEYGQFLNQFALILEKMLDHVPKELGDTLKRAKATGTKIPSSAPIIPDDRFDENGIRKGLIDMTKGKWRIPYIDVKNYQRNKTPWKDTGENFFTAAARYNQNEKAKVAYNQAKTSLPYGPIQPSSKTLLKWKASDAMDKFAGSTTIWQNLNKVFSSIPILGKVTGVGAKASGSASAMKNVGGALSSLGGKFSKIGKAGALLAGPIGAAIGAGVSILGMVYKQMKKSSPVLQAVSSLFELAWNLLWMPLGNALGQFLIPMAEDLINFAIKFNELFTDFSMEKLGEVYYGALQFIWGAIYDIANAIPSAIFNLLIDGLRDLFTMFGWDDAVNVLYVIQNGYNMAIDYVRNLPTEIWKFVQQGFKDVVNFIKDLPVNIGKMLMDVIPQILNFGKNVVESASNWLDSINPHWFATGGIVTGPTLGIVGEAGPEAVIPLDRANGIGTTYVININGDVYGVSDLETRIERVIQRTANKAYYR